MERTGSRREGPRFAVLGLGNRIQGGEALGAIVVERLPGAVPGSLAGSVELIAGGTGGRGRQPDGRGMGPEPPPPLAGELPDLLPTISERLTAWAAEIGSENGAM